MHMLNRSEKEEWDKAKENLKGGNANKLAEQIREEKRQRRRKQRERMEAEDNEEAAKRRRKAVEQKRQQKKKEGKGTRRQCSSTSAE